MNCKTIQNKISEIIDLDEISKNLSEENLSHLNNCENCQDKLNEYRNVDDILLTMKGLTPPSEVTENYLAEIYQKLESQKQSTLSPVLQPGIKFIKALLHSFAGRFAIAGIAVVVISFGMWKISSRNNQMDDYLTSDSIEYYLESFNEVSAVNPVYVVNGVEYDWSYIESNNGNE